MTIDTNSGIAVDRVIVKAKGNLPGPTIVAVGGMHGNEPSGVIALQNVSRHLAALEDKMRGTFVGLSGNLKALRSGKRYINTDLNRLWNTEIISKVNNSEKTTVDEEMDEMRELIDHLREIDKEKNGSIIFLDLHTTSSPTQPFIIMSDTLMNRRFAKKFNLPTVLGVEEHIRTPMMIWLNDLGHVAVAFEAGQHDDPVSVKHQENFIYGSIVNSGILTAKELKDAGVDFQSESYGSRVYEIRYRFGINNRDAFVMNPGYRNFQQIKKGEHLAQWHGEKVLAEESGQIFMPLYQETGDDGFFVIKKINPFWLGLSAMLRRLKFENLLILMPGISRDPAQRNVLRVNLRVAKFYAKEIFHLLGFRMTHHREKMICFERRKFDFRGPA